MTKAPFPYFGGKSKIAGEVWKAFGTVKGYYEPFAGSIACLLEKPFDQNRFEVVNDMDHYIVNFWRSVKNDPEQTAYYANDINAEADLMAKHIWLVNEGRALIENMEADPALYNPQVAGWWVWGMANWIGSGFCTGEGPWQAVDGKLVKSDGQGVKRQLLHLSPGQGVNRQRLHLSDGQGVERRLPNLGCDGLGVNRKRLHLGNNGLGVNKGYPAILNYFEEIAERLRYVRICCGDWERIVTTGATCAHLPAGVFLDPPYSNGIRSKGLYSHDDGDVTRRVYDWCLKNQDNFRIVLAGYEGEYDLPGWSIIRWKASTTLQRASGNGKNKENRFKETLWLSPSCITEPERLL